MMVEREGSKTERDAERDDEVAEIRYSLTALGEALLAERTGPRFRGFGPCQPTLSVAG